MRAHYSYKIGLFLHDKPAIEIDENDHSNINIDYERKKTKGNGKNPVASSLQSVLKKKTFIYSKISMKYLDTSNKNIYHNV